MIECEAEVAPNQPWSQEGTADITLKRSCGLTGTRNIPLKHFEPGQEVQIDDEEYPLGLVVVPTEGYPTTNPEVLPCRISSGGTIILGKQDWPKGAVGIFVDV
jgi:hypothetical protein